MNNLDEQKEKAWEEYQVNCKYESLQGLFNLAFDAGVKAERERILDYLLSRQYKEEDLLEFLNWHELIPEKEGGE